MFNEYTYENLEDYFRSHTAEGTKEAYEREFGEFEIDGYWIRETEDGKIIEMCEEY